LRHVGFELDDPGKFGLRRLYRDHVLDLFESGLVIARGFSLNEPGYILRGLPDGFVGNGRADKAGGVRLLNGRIGINDQFRRRRVSVRRLGVIHRVYGMNVVAARM
jgi:hypothetical protein